MKYGIKRINANGAIDDFGDRWRYSAMCDVCGASIATDKIGYRPPDTASTDLCTRCEGYNGLYKAKHGRNAFKIHISRPYEAVSFSV